MKLDERRGRRTTKRNWQTPFMVAIGTAGLATGAWLAQLFFPPRQPAVGERIVVVQGTEDKEFNFSAFDVTEGILKTGWHKPDKSGVWSKQTTAELVLEAGPTYSALRLSARVRSFVSQHLRVIANGVEIGKWRLRTKFTTHQVILPSKLIGGDGYVELTFVSEQVASAKKIGQGTDDRDIGIRLSRIRLETCRRQCSF